MRLSGSRYPDQFEYSADGSAQQAEKAPRASQRTRRKHHGRDLITSLPRIHFDFFDGFGW
jgi:hypothetical protein